MKRTVKLVLVCAFTLMATTARADDGGWLDWMYGLDTKLVGIGTDVHLLCLTKDIKPMQCENWFKNVGRVLVGLPPINRINFDQIGPQFDLRLAAYWKYGSRFNDVDDERALHAYKLMGMYQYHWNRRVQVGGGGGAIIFQGSGFDHFSRGIVTPISAVFSPIDRSVLTLRPELSYITHGLSGADFGNSMTNFANRGEWNFSFAVGYDFRRLPVR